MSETTAWVFIATIYIAFLGLFYHCLTSKQIEEIEEQIKETESEIF